METLQSNAIFQHVKPDIAGLYSHHVTLICDRNFKVLEVYGKTSRMGAIAGLIEQQGDLRALFETGPVQNLEEVPPEPLFFPAKQHLTNVEAMEPFFSALSVGHIRITALGAGKYLGIVNLSGLLPNFYPEKTNALIYIGNGDRLLGFNLAFSNLVEEGGENPERFLNRPAADFMTPSPAEIQKAGLENIVWSTRGFSCREWDFTSAQDSLPLPLGSSFTKSALGLAWKNEGPENAYLFINTILNTRTEDFSFSLELSNMEDDLPVLLVGGPEAEGRAPDFEGYLAGMRKVADGFVLKKSGHNLAFSRAPLNLRDTSLAFLKRGKCLALHREGKPIVSHYDSNALTYEKARLAVGLRPGSACVIRKIRLHTAADAPQRPAQVQEAPIIRIKGRPDHALMLNRFFNDALTNSGSFPDVAGYFLQDISAIQNRMDDLSHRYERTRREGRALKSLLQEHGISPESFVGQSPAILALKEKARVIAKTDAIALLQGPTGTGKEILAHFIHNHSNFKNGPFVKVDCSALPKELMESELFGHEKGAFTGAVESKTGRFEQANHGTLFLDEVGNLTAGTQAKLLQFLQDFSIVRVGGGKTVKLTLRVIAATNVPLQDLVNRGLFREDLYYRLYVMVLNLPPLRDRLEDLSHLCDHFIAMFSSGKDTPRLSPAAYRKLHNHSWQGNIRELKNVMQRAVLFCEDGEISEDLIRFDEGERTMPEALILSSEIKTPAKPYHALVDLTPEAVTNALKKHRGRVTRVAAELGVTARALYFYFKKFGIMPDSFRYRQNINP